MRKKIYMIFALLLLAGIFRSYSQCLMLESSLNDRIQVSSAVFEGKVINNTSFWNEQHTSIFTSNTIEVYKVFKGDFSASQVEVITHGGTVGTSREVETPSLELNIGDIGVFLVQKSKITNSPIAFSDNLRFEANYAATQDLIKYDLVERTATDVFHSYKNIETDVYDAIVKEVGKNYSVIKTFDTNSTGYRKADGKSLLAPIISNFSPTTITSGTLSVLTINGSGFGPSYTGSAKVEFKDCDNGGQTFYPNNASNIISWSATQIQVQVPHRAGTGQIRVTDNTGAAVTSTGTLTVTYDELTCTSSNVEYQIKEANKNSAGGYTLYYNTNFKSNAPAVAAFERALNTWRCGVYVNFSVSPTATSIACNGTDNTCVVTFDGSCTIPSPYLGMTNSYWNACSSGGWKWTLTEFDIRFSVNATGNTWNYGPGATTGNKIDFESVCLHELGHGVQIGHLIDVGKLMHWQIDVNKDNRTITPSTDQAAGNDIIARSLTSYPCGPTAIIKLTAGNCSLPVENNELTHNDNISFYPNPFENTTVLHISNTAGKQMVLVIFDLLGNQVKQAEVNESEYTLTRDKLNSGMYFYQIKDEENVIGSGKLIVAD